MPKMSHLCDAIRHFSIFPSGHRRWHSTNLQPANGIAKGRRGHSQRQRNQCQRSQLRFERLHQLHGGRVQCKRAARAVHPRGHRQAQDWRAERSVAKRERTVAAEPDGGGATTAPLPIANAARTSYLIVEPSIAVENTEPVRWPPPGARPRPAGEPSHGSPWPQRCVQQASERDGRLRSAAVEWLFKKRASYVCECVSNCRCPRRSADPTTRHQQSRARSTSTRRYIGAPNECIEEERSR